MTIGAVVSLALYGSAPLMLVTLGLVQYAKRLGIAGNALLIISMVVGLILGGAYMTFTTAPSDALGWFSVVIYGIVIGLVTSGVYDVAKGLLPKQ